MERRKLGRSELQVSPLCLGGNVFGWTADEATSSKLLDAFVDAGGNFVDTADVYSKWIPGHHGGESETVLGNWFRSSGKRHQVILASKVGMELAPDRKGLAKSYILRAVEDSLKRLQTDYIDLYQSHKDDPNVPLEETLEAFTQLIEQGKVRAIGASNYSGARLSEALKTSSDKGLARYESLQPEYNLYARAHYEGELEPVCEENGLGVIPYYSLAAGFLTGKYRSEADLANKQRGGTVKKFMDDRGFAILDALDEVAKGYHSTPARVALAWLIARPSITASIASATTLDQLHDLVEATALKLDTAAVNRLNEASAVHERAAV